MCHGRYLVGCPLHPAELDEGLSWEVLDTWPDCLMGDGGTEHFLTTAFPQVPVRSGPATDRAEDAGAYQCCWSAGCGVW